MRKAEIFTLKWSQIDFKSAYIEVLKTKSGKARKIPISKILLDLLTKLHENSESDFVFPNPKTKLPYVSIERSFHRITSDARVLNFRFHDLRHTVATRLVENGVDLLLVKEILGHTEIKTTMRYAHPVQENKKQAIDTLCL